jgi:small basic protein
MYMTTIEIGMLVGIWLCVIENMMSVDEWDVNLRWISIDVIFGNDCVVDGALKEYLKPTWKEIRCKGNNPFISRVLWY